jgi:hypothetical protein
MRQTHKPTAKTAAPTHNMSDDTLQRPRLAGDALRDHQPRRRWPATIGTLILGATVGAIVGMTSRPTHPATHDPGFDDGNPQPTPPGLTPDIDPAPTGDDYHDSVANDDGWPRAD